MKTARSRMTLLANIRNLRMIWSAFGFKLGANSGTRLIRCEYELADELLSTNAVNVKTKTSHAMKREKTAPPIIVSSSRMKNT